MALLSFLKVNKIDFVAYLRRKYQDRKIYVRFSFNLYPLFPLQSTFVELQIVLGLGNVPGPYISIHKKQKEMITYFSSLSILEL